MSKYTKKLPNIISINASGNDLNYIDVTGETNILQLKTLFEKSDIVITPDSGSAHLAVATNKPIIMIPASFLGGAVFCLFSDLVARS